MSRAKPITPVAWHPLDAILGGTGMSRACEVLCGGAQSPEAQAAIAAAEALRAEERLGHVERLVSRVIEGLIDHGVPDIEMTMASIGAVLVATSKAALLLRGRSETEIDTMITVEVEDSSVLAALRLLQRGH